MDNRFRTLRSNVPTPRSYLPPPTARSAGRRSFSAPDRDGHAVTGEPRSLDRGAQRRRIDAFGVVLQLDLVADVLGVGAADARDAFQRLLHPLLAAAAVHPADGEQGDRHLEEATAFGFAAVAATKAATSLASWPVTRFE